MIRLAIVGVGGYGGILIRALAQAEDRCRLVAAADTRLGEMPQQAADLQARGVRLYPDAVAMFDDLRGQCDAVYIASGIASHAPLTVAAARCGYHVHLEKPPAATVQEVDEMLAALDEAGRVCLVGFQALHGHMRLVLDAVADGRLSAVTALRCAAGWPRNRSYYERNDWAGRLGGDGHWVLDGPATNALAHQLAHMLAMASPEPGRLAVPVSVRAELYAAGCVESHNVAAIEVHTDVGATLHFYCSHATRGQFGPEIHLDAESGRAVYDHGKSSEITLDDGSTERRAGESREYPEMIANFIEAVRSGEAAGLRCPLGEARNYVLALDGAHESSGRVHRIGDEYWRIERDESGEQRIVVDGLDELLQSACQTGRLLSDLPDAPPWAVRTPAFDLAGYTRFPRVFAGGQGDVPAWP